MADGILDYITDNWRDVLGMMGPSSAQAATPQPPPAAAMAQQAGASFAPGAPNPGADQIAPGNASPPPPYIDPRNGPQSSVMPGGLARFFSMLGPSSANAAEAPPQLAAPKGDRLPIAAPPPPQFGPGTRNPGAATLNPGSMSPQGNAAIRNWIGGQMVGPDGHLVARPAPPPNGPPAGVPRPPAPLPNGPPAGAPPPPPNIDPNNGPPSSVVRDGLAGSLGLPPGIPLYPQQNPRGQAIQSTMAALGHGLSSLGNLRPGATGAQAFAAGAGGALQGGYTTQQKQEEQARQRWQDALLAQKTGFEENLQTKNYDLNKLNAAIRERMSDAQLPWWQARADVLKTQQGQSNSYKAWQMSPPGQYHLAETEIQANNRGIEQKYREELKQASLSGDKNEMARVRGIMKQESDEYRAATYKRYNLDPAKKDEIEKRGFVGTEEEIKHLPPGTRFWDGKAGVTRIRKPDSASTPIGADKVQAAQPTPYEQYGSSADAEA